MHLACFADIFRIRQRIVLAGLRSSGFVLHLAGLFIAQTPVGQVRIVGYLLRRRGSIGVLSHVDALLMSRMPIIDMSLRMRRAHLRPARAAHH